CFDVGDQLFDLRVREERLHRRHQRERIDEARVVEGRALPVVRVPARLLRQVRSSPLRTEQIWGLVAAVVVARLRDLRIEKVEPFATVLWTHVPGVSDVAAVLREEVPALDGSVREW